MAKLCRLWRNKEGINTAFYLFEKVVQNLRGSASSISPSKYIIGNFEPSKSIYPSNANCGRKQTRMNKPRNAEWTNAMNVLLATRQQALTFIDNAVVAESTYVAVFTSECSSEETFTAVACQHSIVKLRMTITTHRTDRFTNCAWNNTTTLQCLMQLEKLHIYEVQLLERSFWSSE